MATLTIKERIQNNCGKFNANFLNLLDQLTNLSTNDFSTTTNIRTFMRMYTEHVGGLDKGEPKNPERLRIICREIFSELIIHRTQIKGRKIDYFLDQSNPLYKDIGPKEVQASFNFINSLDKKSIDSIWQYFDIFLTIAERVAELEAELV